ncbi:aminomethyl-transferring glycine dehydrogenase subunit GcvPA [Eubacteriales bacterium OttesenSCG-928-N14]|nr:aminomethyl-transferring glycine dehydrogenase subunit GcvPA [Eubacteriales bacterium OttesenSCG-928-N14]
MNSYIPLTTDERQRMMQAVGVQTLDELFDDIPPAARLAQPLDIPSMGEVQLMGMMGRLAAKNVTDAPIFLGAGAYRHYIPATVQTIISRSEFLTAYTPYQAEMSQGLLQSIFEYQSMICNLTGMEVSNASVYDGATACAEAMGMARNAKRKAVFAASAALHPDVLATLHTYAHAWGIELRIIPAKDGVTDIAGNAALLEGAAGMLFAQPNFYGCLEDVDAISAAAEAADALRIAMVNPISLGLLKQPGSYADIAVGDGQSLGNAISFGGPGLGFMATTKKYMRNLPGRIVGKSTDADGNTGYLLTLQAREQHIRRDKAASNICSNQALNALSVAVYLATVGDEGLRQTAVVCHANAQYLKEKIAALPGYSVAFSAHTFHEFVIQCPVPAAQINDALLTANIIGGLDLAPYELDHCMLLCCTEVNTKDDMDALTAILEEVGK